ncbi:hypothetical protein V1290_003961 [Bradyrhizobium sp. AZCC 1578]
MSRWFAASETVKIHPGNYPLPAYVLATQTAGYSPAVLGKVIKGSIKPPR